MTTPPPVGVHHPSWCRQTWEDRTYGDGTREVVHDIRLARVANHDLWLMSYQFVDPAGHVTIHDEVLHLGGEGPLSPAEAEQLAAALVRGARLLEADRAARNSTPNHDPEER